MSFRKFYLVGFVFLFSLLSLHCHHLKPESKTDKIQVLDMEYSNKGKAYEKISKLEGVKGLEECDCLPIFKRNLVSNEKRNSIRDRVDQETLSYLKSFYQSKKQTLDLVFWGSGELLNELTICCHLIEEGFHLNIDLYDGVYLFYHERGNEKKMKEVIASFLEDERSRPSNLYRDWREATVKSELESLRDIHKKIDLFTKIIKSLDKNSKIKVLSEPENLMSKKLDAVFALDAFVMHPGQLKEQINSELHFYLHKYDKFGNCLDLKKGKEASFEVWQDFSETGFLHQFKKIYQERWVYHNKKDWYERKITRWKPVG